MIIRDVTQPQASFTKIGRELCGRDHSTVIHLDRRGRQLVAYDPELRSGQHAVLLRLGL